MKCWELPLGGVECRVYGEKNASFLMFQMVDDHDLAEMGQEAEAIAASAPAPFLLVGVPVRSWNDALSPWPASAVFGKDDFGGCAADTLSHLREAVLPDAIQAFSPADGAQRILGGYSLAGLFALWAGHTDTPWLGIAAASPSVWFPDWLAFAKAHPPFAQAVYLSLGDREEKTRNPVMAQVGDGIRALYAYYETLPRLSSTLEWNAGNHFRDAGLRTAKAFSWVMRQLAAE